MDDFVHNRRDVLGKMGGAEAWLDSITYYDLLDRLGYGAEVRRYIDPYIAVANFGVCGNAISGLAAHRLGLPGTALPGVDRSEEHTSELQSLMRISYAVFCLKNKKKLSI